MFCETRFTSVDVGGGLVENHRGLISQVPEPWATRQACRFWSCLWLPLSHSGGVGAARTAHDGYGPALCKERASTAPPSSALLWLNPGELHSSAGASPHTSEFRGVSPVSLSGVPLAPLSTLQPGCCWALLPLHFRSASPWFLVPCQVAQHTGTILPKSGLSVRACARAQSVRVSRAGTGPAATHTRSLNRQQIKSSELGCW